MKLSKAAHDKLRELLDICVAQRRNASAEFQLGTTYLIPDTFWETKDLKDLVNIGGIRSIGLSIECLDLLEQEDGLLYLDRKQLHDAVDALAVTIQKDDITKFKNPRYTTALIAQFCQEYLREERHFDIAFVIAGPLVVGTSPLPIGDGVLSKWTDEQALAWGIVDEAHPDFVGYPVMIVSAQGVTVDVALERGRLSMEQNLGILGASIGYSTEIGTLLARHNPSIRITSSYHTGLPEIYEQHLQLGSPAGLMRLLAYC